MPCWVQNEFRLPMDRRVLSTTAVVEDLDDGRGSMRVFVIALPVMLGFAQLTPFYAGKRRIAMK